MKKVYFVVILLLCWSMINIKAQQNVPGTPVSFTWNLQTTDIPKILLPKPDMQRIAQEDEEMAMKGKGYRNGVFVQTVIRPNNSGLWDYLPDGSAVWRVRIQIPDAQALGLYFSNYHLKPGMVFYAYTPDKKFVIGGFTELNNNYDIPVMATQEIPGDEVVLELFIPKGTTDYAFEIDKVAYFYRSTPFENNPKVGTCHVNVICPEGDNWRDQIRGVAKVTMVLSNGTYLCSGSLVNNTNQDCKKYFLMADHCSVSGNGQPVTDAQLLQWTFRFNYQATTCTGTQSGPSKVLTGAYYRASDTYGETHSGSDFFLCELKENLTSTINPYFNGWSISTTPATSGVGIHHPAGVIKKISTFTSTLTTYGTTHWQVYWAATANGHGVTEQGSSGSPLFNQNKLVVGTLTGGLSDCNNTNQPDIYGRMDKHFTGIGTSNDKRLKPWLDPTNSNVTTLNGRNLCATNTNDFEQISHSLRTFPNPATDEINIDLSFYELEHPVIHVIDVTNKIVLQQTPEKISNLYKLDIHDLTPGYYILTIVEKGITYSTTFVKN